MRMLAYPRGEADTESNIVPVTIFFDVTCVMPSTGRAIQNTTRTDIHLIKMQLLTWFTINIRSKLKIRKAPLIWRVQYKILVVNAETTTNSPAISLPIAPCQLPIAYCLLSIAYCLLPIAYCRLSIANCLLPIVYCQFPFHPYSPYICSPQIARNEIL